MATDKDLLEMLQARKYGTMRERLDKIEQSTRRSAGINDAFARLLGVDRGEARAIAADIDARRAARGAEDARLAQLLKEIDDERARMTADEQKRMDKIQEDLMQAAQKFTDQFAGLEQSRYAAQGQISRAGADVIGSKLKATTEREKMSRQGQNLTGNDAEKLARIEQDLAVVMDEEADPKVRALAAAQLAKLTPNYLASGAASPGYNATLASGLQQVLAGKNLSSPDELQEKITTALTNGNLTEGEVAAANDQGLISTVVVGKDLTPEGALDNLANASGLYQKGLIDLSQNTMEGPFGPTADAIRAEETQKAYTSLMKQFPPGLRENKEFQALMMQRIQDPSTAIDPEKVRMIAQSVATLNDPRKQQLEAKRQAILAEMERNRAPLTSGEAETLEQQVLRGEVDGMPSRRVLRAEAAMPTAAIAEEKPPTAQDNAAQAAPTAGPSKEGARKKRREERIGQAGTIGGGTLGDDE